MASLPPYYEKTTVGGEITSTAPTTTSHTTSSNTQDYSQAVPSTTSNTRDYSSQATSNTQDYSSSSRTAPSTTNTTAQNDPDTISSAPKLNSEYEPTTEINQTRGSLSSTTGPFQTPTTDDVSGKDVPLTSSVGTQNAPGRAGDIGEKALGAFGYGGSQVERPKEDQGLGEKIINFLGA